LTTSRGLSAQAVGSALTVLGARGLVGFDLHEGSYFHRELPFDMARVETLQPRLVSARKLIAEDKIRPGERSARQSEWLVAGTGVEHRVRLMDDEAKCTCPWFAKHGTTRGPCKHVLAAQILWEGEHG